jgi:hypothetical protein
MKMMKHIQTWLLITLLALSANGVANAKLASGHQNLGSDLHQSQTVLNALLHQGLGQVSTTDTSGSPLATKGLEVGASRLVGANRAIIDPRKLTEYALNPNHPVGGNKAKVFESALGFNQSNASSLMTQLQKGAMNVTPVAGKVDKFGARFTLDIPVTGPLGSGTVRTGWIYKAGSNIPEMTTLFVK